LLCIFERPYIEIETEPTAFISNTEATFGKSCGLAVEHSAHITIRRSWVQFPSNPMLDGSGVKAMPGTIPTPNSSSLWKNKENTGSQMGQTKNIFLKKHRGYFMLFTESR